MRGTRFDCGASTYTIPPNPQVSKHPVCRYCLADIEWVDCHEAWMHVGGAENCLELTDLQRHLWLVDSL